MMRGSLEIYLAAPLFNRREREYNYLLTQSIESVGASVFLPQRDGALLVDMLAAGVPQVVAERRVFIQDTEAMRRCSILVAVLDGAVIDDGVAFEVGFMAALGKKCVGIQTDVRRALPSGNNPMIGQSIQMIFSDEGQLVEWVSQSISQRGSVSVAS